MPDGFKPILTRIVDDMVETLEGVSAAAGDDRTLTVERPKQSTGNTRRDGLAVVHRGSPKMVDTDDPDGGSAYNFVTWLQPFAVVLTVVESETSETSVDERLDTIRADVERALLEDGTRGGLAIDTRLGDPEYPEPDKPNSNVGEVWVVFIVQYRTRYGDPYSQE